MGNVIAYSVMKPIENIGMRMSIFCRAGVCLVILGVVSGCASTNVFLGKRLHDAADIVTITAGTGIGANVRCGVFHAGLFADKSFVGLRGGEFFLGSLHGEETFDFLTLDATVYALQYAGAGDSRKKGLTLLSGLGTEDTAVFCPFIMSPASYPETDKSVYSQIEVGVGLGVGLQIGFNPGELIDFLLGWTGIDIYKDDLSKISNNNK